MLKVKYNNNDKASLVILGVLGSLTDGRIFVASLTPPMKTSMMATSTLNINFTIMMVVIGEYLFLQEDMNSHDSQELVIV